MKSIHYVFMGIIGVVIFAMGCATNGTSPSSSLSGHPNFENTCSKCHTLDRVSVAHDALSKEQMRKIVQHMSQKPGSGIDPNRIEDIVAEIY